MIRKEFRKELVGLVRKRGFEISEVICVKNNGERDGILFYNKSTFSPVIYLEPYFEEYICGEKLSHIVENIIEQISLAVTKERTLQELSILDQMRDYPLIRKNLKICLINRTQNELLLKKVPHKSFGDFASIVYWMLGKESYRIMLRHDILKKLDVDFETVYRDAYINMMGEFVIKRYEDIMYESMEEKLKNNKIKDIPIEKYIKQMCKGSEIHIVKHKSGIFGSAALCYPREMERIASTIRGDFLLLPSSIHQLIIMPFGKSISLEAIQELIRYVNSKMDVEDRLTDMAYIYSTEEKLINTCEYMKKNYRQTIQTNDIHQYNEYVAQEEWRNR